MAEIKRRTRNLSPPPRPMPNLPNPIRFEPSRLSTTHRRSQSLHIPHPSASPFRAIDPSLISSSRQSGTFNNFNNANSPSRRLLIRERQIVFPQTPPPSSNNTHPFIPHHQQQYEQFKSNDNDIDDTVAIPTLTTDDGLPVVSMAKTNLPVFARFPFDVTFIPRPMDTNVEDNIHKLRLRLIESELERQRRSTDEYIKRTQDQISRLSSKSIEENIRSPTNVISRRVTPMILSRQPSFGSVNIDRIGLENDSENNLNLDREFEIRRRQESMNSGRRSNQQLMLRNYSYDPRLHLQPVNEEQQYLSSNMDDLIDSMARRHLAYRRFDATIDHQRRNYGPYFEPSIMSRQASLRNRQRNDDVIFPTTASAVLDDHDFIRMNFSNLNQISRSRNDHSNRISIDLNPLGIDDIIQTNSYPKLPPISPGYDSSRPNRLSNPTTSALYQAKHNPSLYRNYQQSAPLNLPDHTEHLIDLPSDIFLTSRTDALDSPQRRQSIRKSKPKRVSKDKSDVSPDSESNQSDSEKKTSSRNRRKQKAEQTSPDDHEGFFTEGKLPTQSSPIKKVKTPRILFQKAAIGIYFFCVLKSRAAKSRLTRPNQTLSATIHKIRIQEILVALHRVYLEPDGPIYNALIQTINNSIELKDALKPSSKNNADAISVIGEALKNVISRIVDFMPRDGVLGTSKNSAIAALMQDGNPFPENYFWDCEKNLLEFNKLKVIHITRQRAILLLIGIFIFRALVTTLLIKPIKYRLILGQLTDLQTDNIKVLASIMFYIGRRVVQSSPTLLPLAREWKYSLYSDADIEPIIEHSEIKSILTTCELSLRVWCEEYIRRIDASFDKELRT